MPVEPLELPVPDGKQPLLVARPETHSPSATLVIMPSIFGLQSDLVKQMEELSEHGTVVALDPFWRVEPGPIPYDDLQRAVTRAMALDRSKAFGDWVAVLKWARGAPHCDGRVIALGICYGGPYALLAAAEGLVDGVVTWHGSRMDQFVGRVSEMRVPMVHHVGSDDPVVPPEALRALRGAFADRDDVTFVVHEGAVHGFTHAGSAHDARAAAAAMDSVRRMLTPP